MFERAIKRLKRPLYLEELVKFKQIREKRHFTADLLLLMSFFNSQGIPSAVLRSHARNAAEMDDKEGADSEFDDDLETLRTYSLMTATAESDMCEMH
jgi:hypothetical protein